MSDIIEPMNGVTLDQLRRDLGLSWATLSHRMGVSDQTLRRIRAGESKGLPILHREFRKLREEADLRSRVERADDV